MMEVTLRDTSMIGSSGSKPTEEPVAPTLSGWDELGTDAQDEVAPEG